MADPAFLKGGKCAPFDTSAYKPPLCNKAMAKDLVSIPSQLVRVYLGFIARISDLYSLDCLAHAHVR